MLRKLTTILILALGVALVSTIAYYAAPRPTLPEGAELIDTFGLEITIDHDSITVAREADISLYAKDSLLIIVTTTGGTTSVERYICVNVIPQRNVLVLSGMNGSKYYLTRSLGRNVIIIEGFRTSTTYLKRK